MAALAVLATALVASGVWSRPTPTESLERVAILPFEIAGGSEHNYLREALVDLLSTDLDGAGGMQTIDPNAVRVSDTAAVKLPAAGRTAARRLGVRYFILGRAVVAGGRLRVHAALYDQTDEPLAEATQEGAADQVFAIVDGLAVDLLTSSQRKPDVRLSKSAAMTTQSLPALKAYLEGEQAFQRGDDKGAQDAMRRAVAIDSTFALANYRLSVVVTTSSAGAWAEISESGERALRHGNRLSERDRLLLSAHMASVKEDVGSAEQQYRAIVARYPDELEAWFRLAEVIFHETPLTGRSIVDAREPFEQLLALDPANRHALQHLMWIAAVQKRYGAIDTLYRRIVSSGLTPTAKMEARALWAFTSGSTAEREKFFADAATDPGAGTWVVSNFARDMDATRRLVDLRASQFSSEAEQRVARVTRARLFAVRGQMDSANAELNALGRFDRGRALQEGAFLAIMPFRSLSEGELRSWRTRIAAWEVERTDLTTLINNDVDGPFRHHVRFFLLGYVDGLLRDSASVRADADSLERLALPKLPDAAQFVAELSASIRAHALWRQGNTGAALDLIDRAPVARQFHYRNSFMRRQDRYVRAELLFAAGRLDEAIKWYSAFDYITLAQSVFAMPAHLRRGEIHEKLGNPREAAANYREFNSMWRNADAVFRPMTALAEARLQALGAK